MGNRVMSLFDLDELLGTATARTRGGRKPARKRPLSGAKGSTGRVISQAFDGGEPISLRYSEASVRALCRPEVMPGGPRHRAREQSFFVESFEEDEESIRVPELETAETEEDAELLASLEGEAEPDESEAQSRRAGGRIPAPTPAQAAQVAAFEREIQGLTTRAKAQDSPATFKPKGPTDSGTESAESDADTSGSTKEPPERRDGHAVFDRMAQGMATAQEFRLPPVAVQRLFHDLDRQIDSDEERARSRALAEQTVAAMPEDEVLARDLAALAASTVDPEQAGRVLADQLGSGQLLHFTPEELELDEEDTLAVFAFFWPDMDLTTLGPITDQDRSFAQALMIEAADMSHAMGIVDAIYKTFFMKVPTSFKSIRNALVKLGKKAIEDGWFKKIKTVEEAEKVQIYESVRTRLQANFVTVMRLRRATGELTGY